VVELTVVEAVTRGCVLTLHEVILDAFNASLIILVNIIDLAVELFDNLFNISWLHKINVGKF
jgi:hypothetical protein